MKEFFREWDAKADAIEAEIKAERALQPQLDEANAQFEETKALVDAEQAKLEPSVGAEFIEQSKRISTLLGRMSELMRSRISPRVMARTNLGTRISLLQVDLAMQSAKQKAEQVGAIQERLDRATALLDQWSAFMKETVKGT